jgi:hypothetical protein
LTPINVAGFCVANSKHNIGQRLNRRDAMSSNPKALASGVVDAFQALLDSNVREAIGENHFHELHGMIREAIAEQSEAMLERLELNMSQIRSEMVERRPLEL